MNKASLCLLVTYTSLFSLIQSQFLRETSASSTLIFNFPRCIDNADCNNNGLCDINTGHCICNSGYSTYVPYQEYSAKYINYTNATIVIQLERESFQVCNYQQKRQLTALLLSIFVGFGAEHLYLEHISQGVGKFFFYIICYCLNIALIVIYFCCKEKREYLAFIGTFEGVYLACGMVFMILWNIYDCVKIGFMDIKDGNGMPMYSWNDN